MNIIEIKKTHEEITEKATVNVKGYSLCDNTVKIWDGQQWESGIYTVDSQGEMTYHESEFDLLTK